MSDLDVKIIPLWVGGGFCRFTLTFSPLLRRKHPMESLEVATPSWGRSVSSIFSTNCFFEIYEIYTCTCTIFYDYEKTRSRQGSLTCWRDTWGQRWLDPWSAVCILWCSFPMLRFGCVQCLFRQRGGCVQRQTVHHSGDQACGSLRFDIEI